MTRDLSKRHVRQSRSGVALLVVIILIGLFGMMCQALAMLIAMQHRHARQACETAQATRLGEAGLLRGTLQLQSNTAWTGETWSVALPDQSAATVEIAVQRRPRSSPMLSATAEVSLKTGRVLKSSQTLALPATSVSDGKEGRSP